MFKDFLRKCLFNVESLPLKSMSEELLMCILLVFCFFRGGSGMAILTKAMCQYLVFQI